jgi:chromosome segregation ATPase
MMRWGLGRALGRAAASQAAPVAALAAQQEGVCTMAAAEAQVAEAEMLAALRRENESLKRELDCLRQQEEQEEQEEPPRQRRRQSLAVADAEQQVSEDAPVTLPQGLQVELSVKDREIASLNSQLNHLAARAAEAEAAARDASTAKAQAQAQLREKEEVIASLCRQMAQPPSWASPNN